MSQYDPYPRPLPGPPANPYPYVQVLQRPQSSTLHLVLAWTAAVLTAGYLLPWAVAATRNKSNTAAIALIDLFLGWSIVGWVVALVMACGSEPAPTVVVHTGQPLGYAPPPPYAYPPPAYAAPAPRPIAPRPQAPEPTLVDYRWDADQQPTQPLPGIPYGSDRDHLR